ncbi:MAG TPA: tetratricopeptide repeat protein [Bacteroidia bacterium]|nr:tetratricopeptide repeat protein [Bacteroidia bacterium]
MATNRIELLKSYIEEDPDDIFSVYALALEYSAIESFGEAIPLLENLQKNHPDYLPTYYQLGKLLEKTGNFSKAIEVYILGEQVASKQNDIKTRSELLAARENIE